MRAIETDYLVVGAGAAGMAFADSLLTHSDAEVVLVDRRDRPGGHWNDAYPFVRLHQPSAFYGVASTVLGSDAIDEHGPNAGFYERATAPEICAYFAGVLERRLLPSGQVRFLGMSEHAEAPGGEHLVTSRLTGEVTQVRVRRKVVDATYLETPVPATHAPSFSVDPGARLIPVNGLADVAEAPSSYVIIGSGKTGMDACCWLLDNGVEPERIRWIRPRDAWLLDRAGWQPLSRVGSLFAGFALEMEAVAQASDLRDLFDRLEAAGRLVRIDEQVAPTMYRCANTSQRELAQLRQIDDVIRLGRVLHIGTDEVVLEHGAVATDQRALHVDCSAVGLRSAPPKPVFEPGRITLQQVRYCSPTFNSALIAFIEATRDDVVEQNRLCPVSPYPVEPRDWLSVFAVTTIAANTWLAEPDLAEWLDGCRLNALRGLTQRLGEPQVQEAFARYAANLEPAMAAVPRLLGEAEPAPAA